MIEADLIRVRTSDEGTFGAFTTGKGLGCLTIELPWRDNARMISCIPAGDYVFRPVDSPKRGPGTYEAQEPLAGGRTKIQIHSANWAGDASKNLKSQLLGCIAPGSYMMDLGGQTGVSSSKTTMHRLKRHLGGDDLLLRIRWAPGVLTCRESNEQRCF